MALESCPRDLQGENLVFDPSFLSPAVAPAGGSDVWSQRSGFQNVTPHKNAAVINGSLAALIKKRFLHVRFASFWACLPRFLLAVVVLGLLRDTVCSILSIEGVGFAYLGAACSSRTVGLSGLHQADSF